MHLVEVDVRERGGVWGDWKVFVWTRLWDDRKVVV